MRRDDICLYLNPDDRAQLQALVIDRNTPRKLVWRAEIVLATADGHGTNEIMRRASTSKPPSGDGRGATLTRAWLGSCASEGDRQDGAGEPAQRYPLESGVDGRGGRHLALERGPHLG